MIDRTLAQLQVMEGDKALVEDAKKQVKGVLNNVNEQGNYEDAGLAIQDAANHVDQDPGIIAAKKSYENRAMELDFLRKARMEGKQVLDFGQGASENHVPYYFDKNTETFQSNIYEPASEQRLDYDAEMSGLLKTIKADSNGAGWEGITVGKADRVAAMMYGNYLESDAGKQDFRRLVELDLPGSLNDEQKQAMAKKDIMNRLKGFTRQYVYNKVTAPKAGSTATSALGLPLGIMTSGTTSTKGITNDKPQLQSLQNLSIIQNTTMSDEDKTARLSFNQGMMDDSVKAYLMNQGEAGQDKLDRWGELQKAHNKPGDEKFFELTKMLTINTYDSDTDYGKVINNASERGLQTAGVFGVAGASYGAAGGTFIVPGAGTAVGTVGGGLGGMGIGAVTGFISGVAEGVANEMDKF